MNIKSKYKVVIVGGGHNGLVAAAYLAKAGFSVAILEKSAILGGLTVSETMFPGVNIKLSRYAYLIGLMPQKVISDLDINIMQKKRNPGVFIPYFDKSIAKELIFSDSTLSKYDFINLVNYEKNYQEYLRFRNLQNVMGRHFWDSLLQPLRSKKHFQKLFVSDDEKTAWNYFIEQPLGVSIEQIITDNDLLRGLVMTDGLIGCFSHPHDSSLRQNKTFLYHVLANGSGDWNVLVGGMEALVNQLVNKCLSYGVDIINDAEVQFIENKMHNNEVSFIHNGQTKTITADFVLANIAPRALQNILPGYNGHLSEGDEGCYVKINMILSKLPRLKSGIDAKMAFTGTFHINEGYKNLQSSYDKILEGGLPNNLPGEIYCHSLTDDSIIPNELRLLGYHTLTLLGLSLPYRLFTENNEKLKLKILHHYCEALNKYFIDPIDECLAIDSNGMSCINIESPYDVEQKFNIPTGHVFHRELSWPFAERPEEEGTWGVETNYDNILLCGSGAKRGGGISGISGHNAAMKILTAKNN